MEQVKQIILVMENTDINKLDEESLTELIEFHLRRKGYIPADRPVVVREGKVSSIRAVALATQEEVEIYALAQVFQKNGKVKTVITGRVV